MKIAGYLKTSLIEWPGKISSVIFTQGCNFRCPFCHNADLVRSNKATKQQRFKESEILEDLKRRKKWVDAVVITGGEPTLQKDLDKFLKSIKKLKFLTMVHTNGTRPEVIARLLSCYLVDFVAMDLKGDFENYSNYSNCSNDQTIKNIKESMRLIIKSGVGYEFRTTVVPTLHNLENLKRLAGQISWAKRKTSRQGGTKRIAYHVSRIAPKWYLQQFRPMNTLDKKFLKVKPFSKEKMEGFQKELQKIIPNTFLRGI